MATVAISDPTRDSGPRATWRPSRCCGRATDSAPARASSSSTPRDAAYACSRSAPAIPCSTSTARSARAMGVPGLPLPGVRSIVLVPTGWGLSCVDRLLGGDTGRSSVASCEPAGRPRSGEGACRSAARSGASGRCGWPSGFPHACGASLCSGGPDRARGRRAGIIRLIASPAGGLMVSDDEHPRRVRTMLRGSGTGQPRRRPDPRCLVDWRASVSRETDAMMHERAMVRQIVRDGSYTTDLTFHEGELGAIEAPTLILRKRWIELARSRSGGTLLCASRGRSPRRRGAGHIRGSMILWVSQPVSNGSSPASDAPAPPRTAPSGSACAEARVDGVERPAVAGRSSSGRRTPGR